MTIWWCRFHEAKAFETGRQPPSWCNVAYAFDTRNPYLNEAKLCRMVEMDLVPHETSLTGVTIEGVKPIP